MILAANNAQFNPIFRQNDLIPLGLLQFLPTILRTSN